MSETHFDEKHDRWEVHTKMFFSASAMDELKSIHGIDGTEALVSIAFEEAIEQFAKELAKCGVDKNIIAKVACERGCGKIPIGNALGLTDPATS